MKWLSHIQSRLGWKLLLSYLVVILVGVVVLFGTAQFRATSAISQHIDIMHAVLGDDPELRSQLDDTFHAAVNEILTASTAAAVLAAVAVSIFTARRIGDPIRAMLRASRHIADGDYHARVQVPGQDELGALALSFNRMADALERTEQRRMELIGNVAHELRTPLSGVKGMLEGLVDGVLPSEPATFLSMEREVARLQRLVHDLEDLSRAEAGQISLDIRPTDPGALISDAADRLRQQFDDKHVGLDLALASELPQVAADASRITQVLLNLLGNALQYTPASGHVVVRCGQAGSYVLFSVEDTGIGLSPNDMAHVFERFYRVDKSRSRAGGGSGIGLTISRYLVEAHHGEIWVKSPGHSLGSTFAFTLPISG
jgi:two-component system sensor histidine kinase BaeS